MLNMQMDAKKGKIGTLLD